MQIWVDADACPRPIKEILYRVARRREVVVTLVANHPLSVPRGPYVRAVQVSGGFDVADDHIALRVERADVVVTADIPLAAKVIERGAHVITPRGETLSPDNIQERHSVRDFMAALRDTGESFGGPPPLSARDRQSFANALDRLMARRPGSGGNGD